MVSNFAGENRDDRESPNPSSPRIVATAVLFSGLALSLQGAEVVILKDGFVIQGNVRKEITSINDKATGKTFPIVKSDGFDMIDEGPKVVIFSTHAKQLGEVSKEVKLRPEYRAYKREFLRKSSEPLPAGAVTKSSTEFNDKWLRTMEVRVPLGWDKIEQQITYIDPYFTYMVSPTHSWRSSYRTNELDPKKIRKILSTHPELRNRTASRCREESPSPDSCWMSDGCSTQKTISLRSRKTPGGVPMNAKEDFDALAKEIDVATAALVIGETEPR